MIKIDPVYIPLWLHHLMKIESPRGVLLSIIDDKGSAPRKTGSKMWVDEHQQVDSVGGGKIEYQAILDAREMLQSFSSEKVTEMPLVNNKIVAYSLGTKDGHACGGHVTVLFECLQPKDKEWICKLHQLAHTHSTFQRCISHTAHLVEVESMTNVLKSEVGKKDASQWTCERIDFSVPFIVVWGAGHIGCAAIDFLRMLPCKVLWIDRRKEYLQTEDLVKMDLPAHIGIGSELEVSYIKSLEVPVYHLVCTFGHPEDYAVISELMQLENSAFIGLVGSKTKRKIFEHRILEEMQNLDHFPVIKRNLQERFFSPVGVIPGKNQLPSVIAMSALTAIWQVESQNAALD